MKLDKDMKQIGILTFLIGLIVASLSYSLADTELDATVKQLSAPEDYKRSRAARALGQMGTGAEVAYDILLKIALFDEVSKVRNAAANALGNIAKERSVSQFIAQLQTNSVALVREYSVDALMQRQLQSPEATVPIFQALRDENERVRRRAGIALQFYKSEELERLLIASLSDETDRARELAPWLLGQMKSQAALAPLHGLLDDGDPKFRNNIVAALCYIRSKSSVPPLIEIVTHDENDEIRIRAIQCLGKIGDPLAIAVVVQALDNENSDVRISAAGAIGVLGVEDAKPRLREILKQDAYGGEMLAAMGALIQMKDADSIPLIVNQLNTEDKSKAQYMMHGLVLLNAEAEIIKLKDQGNPIVRAVAERALEKLQERKNHSKKQIQRMRQTEMLKRNVK